MFGAVLAASMLFFQAAPAVSMPAPTAVAAGAPASSSVSPLTVTGKKADSEKEIVCHTEPVLGSLFPKKVCASRQAIAERTREDQEQVREWVALKPWKSN
jgi:hypothetical protein